MSLNAAAYQAMKEYNMPKRPRPKKQTGKHLRKTAKKVARIQKDIDRRNAKIEKLTTKITREITRDSARIADLLKQ